MKNNLEPANHEPANNEPVNHQSSLRTIIATAVLALLIVSMHVPSAKAQTQPWTAPDASNNINSTNTGNVGVGTTAPPYKLTVSGAGAYNGAGSSQIALQNTTTTTGRTWNLHSGDDGSLQIFRSSDSLTKLYFPAGNATSAAFLNGNVGIGTFTPSYQFVAGPDLGGNFSNGVGTFSKGAGQSASVIVGSTTSKLIEVGWDETNTRGFVNAPGTTPLAFTQNGSGVRMLIDAAGNVGVGTTAPSAKLDVAGNVNASGNLNASGTITGGNIVAKYQDVAEWVPTSKTMAAGTVVVLDSSQSNYVTSSSKSYDTKVAGVVSAQPGIALGEGGKGKVLVATTGRVKVKVDATRSPIHVGDLLVTGTIEGVAMKSEPLSLGGVEIHRPGTLIGKALEPLEKGTGEILVLLSLQ